MGRGYSHSSGSSGGGSRKTRKVTIRGFTHILPYDVSQEAIDVYTKYFETGYNTINETSSRENNERGTAKPKAANPTNPHLEAELTKIANANGFDASFDTKTKTTSGNRGRSLLADRNGYRSVICEYKKQTKTRNVYFYEKDRK